MYIGARPETRLMYLNSLSDATLSSSTPSVTGFSAENITTTSRTSLYIPQDLFIITSANKTFKFKKGNDADVTVTLTEATNYTGTTLAAHMQSVFGNSFVITYSTTTKFFKFQNTSAAFILYIGQHSASWDTVGFVTVTGDTTFSGNQTTVYYADRPRRHTNIKLYYDMGGASDCGFFALLGDRNKTNALSANAVVNLKLSNINDIDSAESVNIAPTINGTFTFLDAIYPVPLFRYFWLTITDRENVSEFLPFSQLFLGGFTSWENRTIDHGFTIQYLDRSIRTESVSGALFFERYNKYPYLSGLQISYLTRDEIALLQQAWFDLGKSEHFYLSLDSGHMNNDLSEFMFFGVFDSDPTIEEVGPRYFNGSFSFRGD